MLLIIKNDFHNNFSQLILCSTIRNFPHEFSFRLCSRMTQYIFYMKQIFKRCRYIWEKYFQKIFMRFSQNHQYLLIKAFPKKYFCRLHSRVTFIFNKIISFLKHCRINENSSFSNRVVVGAILWRILCNETWKLSLLMWKRQRKFWSPNMAR